MCVMVEQILSVCSDPRAWLATISGHVALSSIEPKVDNIGRCGTESGRLGAKDKAHSVGVSFGLCDPPLPTGAYLSTLVLRSAAKFPETGTQATVPTAMLDGALDAVKSARTTTTRNARVMMILLAHTCLCCVADALWMAWSVVHLRYLLDTQIFLLHSGNTLPFFTLRYQGRKTIMPVLLHTLAPM